MLKAIDLPPFVESPMQPRAVIYARYSSEKQREASLEDQIRLCRERAASNGWDVVQVYLDRAMSGATVLRPRYQALMMAAREGDFDILIAEALDRLSRDQEDIAALFKRLNHAGIRIVTLADGEINELHVGLKGTMNALFLKDLRAKTHRGLRGRAEAGQSAGGNAYSYHVLARIGPDSRPTVGEREIVPHEATVIQRIFEAYASGSSPRRIAMDLNASPRRASRHGHPARLTATVPAEPAS
jgi:DNA invertase Pin-like site-specific DNA recombinase